MSFTYFTENTQYPRGRYFHQSSVEYFRINYSRMHGYHLYRRAAFFQTPVQNFREHNLTYFRSRVRRLFDVIASVENYTL